MSENESPSKKKKIDEEFRSSINKLRRDVNDGPTEIPMYHTISEGDGMWVCTVEVPGCRSINDVVININRITRWITIYYTPWWVSYYHRQQPRQRVLRFRPNRLTPKINTMVQHGVLHLVMRFDDEPEIVEISDEDDLFNGWSKDSDVTGNDTPTTTTTTTTTITSDNKEETIKSNNIIN